MGQSWPIIPKINLPKILTPNTILVAQGWRIHIDAGDVGLISESGRSLEKEMATHSNILTWRIPWTEKSGRLLSKGPQELDMT